MREALRDSVARCEFCGRHKFGLEVHEILRGSLRRLAVASPFAQLVLCADCHPLMGGRSLAEQLAILRRSRPKDYNLFKFYGLAQRNYPNGEDVLLWGKRLSFVPSP